MADTPLAALGTPYSSLRHSPVDPVTGNIVRGPSPIGPTPLQLAGAYLGLLGSRAHDAFTAPQRALSGDLQVFDPETGRTTDAAREAASGLAGLAMTGGLGGVAAHAGEAVLGAGPKAVRRLTYDSPLRGQERVSKASAEREIAERQAQIDFAAARGEPVQDALKGQIDALTALLPKFETESFPRGRPFQPARVVDAGDRFAVRVQERGGGDRMYRVLERREDGSLSRPIGSADMMQHPDGRWETSMLEVNPRHQGKGAASALYRAVEQDTGQARVPSGVLLPDGHAFWKARDPEQVAYHQFVDDRYLSPKRLMGGLESRDIGPEYRAKLQAALDAVPPEGKTPEALARQFMLGGGIGLSAGTAALGLLGAPADAQAASIPFGR